MMAKKDKANEKAKRPFHKGGMPPFVPTEEDRAIVKLLVSMGMAQHRVCLRIRGRDGKPIADTTLKKYFADELMAGKAGRARRSRVGSGTARSRARRSIRPWRRTGSRISGESDTSRSLQPISRGDQQARRRASELGRAHQYWPLQ